MTWECKYGHGPVNPGDFVRMPEGSETFYQVLWSNGRNAVRVSCPAPTWKSI